jgi:hypothetical protein
MWETINKKPFGPTGTIGQVKKWNNSQIMFYILLKKMLSFVVPFTNFNKMCKNIGPKPIMLSQTRMF